MRTGLQGSPEEILEQLQAGNIRFVENRSSNHNLDLQDVKINANKTEPAVAILACSDSRVPPEFVLDLGIGDAFVVRNAGNVVDAVVLGSLEYAVACQKVKVLVLLGHTRCGAVLATISGENYGGSIYEITSRIRQSEQKVSSNLSNEPDVLARVQKNCMLVDSSDSAWHDEIFNEDASVIQSIRRNLLNSFFHLVMKSDIIGGAVSSKDVMVVMGIYDVSSGYVRWM